METTDSFPSEEEQPQDGDFLSGAMSYAHRKRMAALWKARSAEADQTGASHEEEAKEHAESPGLPPDPDAQIGFDDEEDERTATVMEEHPEYHEYFDNPDLLGEDGTTPDGTNPFAHVSMHVIVENQLASADPPQVRQYLERFMATGLSRHEAVHHIARAVSTMVFHVLSEQRPHDDDLYLATLEEIAAEVEGDASPE